jgi:hypothetical protein
MLHIRVDPEPEPQRDMAPATAKWLRTTLIINMVKLYEITISESSVAEPEPQGAASLTGIRSRNMMQLRLRLLRL